MTHEKRIPRPTISAASVQAHSKAFILFQCFAVPETCRTHRDRAHSFTRVPLTMSVASARKRFQFRMQRKYHGCKSSQYLAPRSPAFPSVDQFHFIKET